MKEQYYGLEAETTYTKEDGQETPLKYPKIKIEGKNLEENKKYPITLLKEIQTRDVKSKKDGKVYTFKNVFVKYTGTDYAFVAEINDILADQLKKYPIRTELDLSKDWMVNKKGHKVPIVKVEMANNNEPQPITEQPINANVNASTNNPYLSKEEMDDFDQSAWMSFKATETNHSKYNWFDYYARVNGGSLTVAEEEKAKKIYEKMKQF